MQLTEKLSDGLFRVWKLDHVICNEKTAYQNVVIARTSHGTTLFCDDERQSSEDTQMCYHEGQIVPALCLFPTAKKVLVIGSSEGVVPKMLGGFGMEVTHVDIDKRCVTLCAKHLPYGYSSDEVILLQHRGHNVHLRFECGHKFLQQSKEKYDIICVDLPDLNADGEEQHNMLYSGMFYSLVKERLSPDGVFITQAGNASLWRNKGLQMVHSRLQSAFEDLTYFEMEEHEWAWFLGRTQKDFRNKAEVMQAGLRWLTSYCYTPRYIDSDSIEKSIILPKSLRV